MTPKPTYLIAAIAAGLALTASAEARGMADRADRPGFEELDLDGNGSLTREEITNAMAALRQTRFEEADTDGDGALSAEEMLAAAEGRRADRAEAMIERFDDNDDGLLQLSELPDGEGRRGMFPDRMFERLDANEDGMIDAEEFAAASEHRRRGN